MAFPSFIQSSFILEEAVNPESAKDSVRYLQPTTSTVLTTSLSANPFWQRSCLAIQLRELDRYDPAMQALVEHLDLLAKRDIAALRKICGVDDEDIADMIGEIRRLNPKPGMKFGSARLQTMVPDVYVRPGPDGGWHVELNSDTLPRVLVNQTYYSELSKKIGKDGDCPPHGREVPRSHAHTFLGATPPRQAVVNDQQSNIGRNWLP